MNKIEKLYVSSKKNILSAGCIAIVLGIVSTGTALAAEATAHSRFIGSAEAKKVALADAGIDAAATSGLKTDFEWENKKFVYEVEFYAAGVEYDYTLDAESGAVISKTKEGQNASMQKPAVEAGNTNNQIGLEAAREKALTDAQVAAADVTYTKGELDYDDGIQVYDIEFFTATAEYDYEIDAKTAAIVHKSVETFSKKKPQMSASSSYIGVDKAKGIAVSHAGVASGKAVFKKAKLENDDGRVEYEIEFYVGRMEYEYTIDATSGNILEYDFEYDD